MFSFFKLSAAETGGRILVTCSMNQTKEKSHKTHVLLRFVSSL
jgi:hypothetical protein